MTALTLLALTGCLAPEPPGADLDDRLARLPAHPRLVLLDPDLDRLRGLVRDDPVARRWHEQLTRDATALLTAPPTEYKIVGPRLLSASRNVLARVSTLGLLYRLDRRDDFGRRAVAELEAAAGWPQWNPSHFLDTAELNHAFGLGYDWLQPVLGDARAPIREALLTKGLEPARQAYQKGGWWTRGTNNWNQVCNGGNLIGALAVAHEAPELARGIVTAAVAGLPYALRQYAPDGGWAEGPGYWHYATRYTAYALAALETALGSDLGLGDIPGFDRAGDFRLYFAGPSGLSFNYADAGAGAEGAEELFWLARRFGQPAYAWQQRQATRVTAWDLIWFTPEGGDPQAGGLPLDRLFQGVGVTFLRGSWTDPRTTWVAFKGGDNRASHSHLDLGTFVLDAAGQRFIEELGTDNYNLPGYFGGQRWSYYRLNTHGQNTLVINGQNQAPAAKAPTLAFHATPARACGVVDLTAAWPGVRRAHRGVALLDRRDVLLVDEVAAEAPVTVEWGAHTRATVTVDGTRAVLERNGERLYARLLAPAGARFEARSARQEPPQNRNDGVTKLVAIPAGPVTELRLAILFSPVADAPDPAVGTLADWVAAAR